jgi:hypothetical protein
MMKILKQQIGAKKNRLKIKHFSNFQQSCPQSYPQLVGVQRDSLFSPGFLRKQCARRYFSA